MVLVKHTRWEPVTKVEQNHWDVAIQIVPKVSNYFIIRLYVLIFYRYFTQ